MKKKNVVIMTNKNKVIKTIEECSCDAVPAICESIAKEVDEEILKIIKEQYFNFKSRYLLFYCTSLDSYYKYDRQNESLDEITKNEFTTLSINGYKYETVEDACEISFILNDDKKRHNDILIKLEKIKEMFNNLSSEQIEAFKNSLWEENLKVNIVGEEKNL